MKRGGGGGGGEGGATVISKKDYFGEMRATLKHVRRGVIDQSHYF